MCFQKLWLSPSCARSARFMAGAGPQSFFLSTFVAREAQRANLAAPGALMCSLPFQVLHRFG